MAGRCVRIGRYRATQALVVTPSGGFAYHLQLASTPHVIPAHRRDRVVIQDFLTRVRPIRALLLVIFDSAAWIGSFTALAWLQVLVHDVPPSHVYRSLLVGCACAGAFLLLGATVRLHQGRSATGSFENAFLVATVAGIVGVINLAVGLAVHVRISPVIFVAGPLTALLVMIWGRGTYRLVRDRAFGGGAHYHGTEPTLVIGAGEGGRQLIHSMCNAASTQWRPVGLVDDDPSKRHRRIRGVAMMGTTRDLADIRDQTGATTAIIAIPSASSEAIRQISRRASQCGLDVKVLPGTSELLQPSRAAISDIRDIDVTDLLGRHVIDTDLRSIATYLTGKRVLVTGAGGSIGSELCRQISRFEPAELIMLDRDESALHSVQLSLTGRALLDSDDTVLGDIRDAQFVNDLFETRRPHVVFHAAALKHLPLLEKAPGEAIKTNVWGTLTVLEAAAAAGVERFVNISTDKAANPCSVLGYSKRLAEGLTTAIASEADGTYLSVRFGNVLGSRGLGAHRLREPDRDGRSGHRHRPARDPLLHDHRRGSPARDPGGCGRPRRRGAGARHGRAGQHRLRRPPADRPVRQEDRRRLHRHARRREDARGAVRGRRAR